MTAVARNEQAKGTKKSQQLAYPGKKPSGGETEQVHECGPAAGIE